MLSAALIFNPVEDTTLKLLYGEAFRAPNAFELFYDDVLAGVDASQKAPAELDPESIKTYEIVLEQKLGDSLRGSASLYHNEIEDLISLTTDPTDGLFVFKNVDEIKSQGLARVQHFEPDFCRFLTNFERDGKLFNSKCGVNYLW